MWLVTTQGFYSVVAHRDDNERVIVRARAEEDIRALERQISGIEPFEDTSADYRWRAEVSRDEWKQAASELAGEIDYPNFKNAVGDHQGTERAQLYMGVWLQLQELQEDPDR